MKSPTSNPIKRYMVFCEPCTYRQIIEAAEPQELTTIKTSAIPGGSPQLDPATKKAVAPPAKPRQQKVKCPKCGRGIVVRDLPEVYAKEYTAIDERRQQERRAADVQKRIEDGKPIRREKDPDFLG